MDRPLYTFYVDVVTTHRVEIEAFSADGAEELVADLGMRQIVEHDCEHFEITAIEDGGRA